MKIKRKGSFVQLIIMILITLVTQLFLLIRASVVASRFGVSVELDAFNYANSLSTLVFSFISGGVVTVLIPNLGNKEKKKSVNIFITFLYMIASMLLIVMIMFRKWIVVLFGGSSNAQFINVCSYVLITLLISQYLTSYSGLTNAILQYNNDFNRPKLATLLSNVVMVVVLVMFVGDSIYGYGAAVLLTSAINVIIQLILVVKTGFKYKTDFDFKDNDFKIMLKSFIPTILSTGLYQVSLMIDTIIASGLGEGKISILNYSNNIVSMINMLLITNIAAFLYPKISRGIKEADSQEKFMQGVTIVHCILGYIALAVIVVGEDMIKILYMRGKFTPEVSTIVFYCTVIYILAIPASAVRDLVYKYFYANNDTYTPFKNSLLISVLNIAFSIGLSKFIGIYGVVWGTTITSLLSLTFICLKYKKKFGLNFNKKYFLIENLKVIFITVITTVLFMFVKLKFTINNSFIDLVVYGMASLIFYIGMLFVTRCKVFKMKL